MQFTLLHATPGSERGQDSGGIRARLRMAMPLEVQVTGPEARTDYGSICRCTTVYRLTDAAVARLKRIELYPQKLWEGQNNPCVCLCMGSPED